MTGAQAGRTPGEARTDRPPVPDPGDDAALLGVTRALTALSLQAADQLGGVSVVQLRALTLLADLEPISLAELAMRMGVTPSTASRLVDRLVGASLLSRRASADSRRRVELRLTDPGRATLEHYDRLRLDDLRSRLATLSDQSRGEALGCLPALMTALDPAGSGPVA